MNEIVLQLINYWVLSPIFICFRLLVVVLALTFLRRLWVHKRKCGKVCVVVLGDVGRSPRMQYHSLSLANNGFHVNLVGYSGSVPHHNILDSDKIHLQFTKEAHSLQLGPKVLSYMSKVILQTLHLSWTLLFKVDACEYILLQNPPCIPSMAVCWMVANWNGSKLIIDWHNYGFSILALSLGKLHPLVKIARWYEEFFGQLSFGHLCVTKALENDLMQKWNISAEVMHDRPAKIFKPLNDKEKHNLFLKLSSQYPEFKCSDSSPNATRFTKYTDGKATLAEKRPVLIVSSTSWTEDEDFSILLEALQDYDEMVTCESTLPDVLCAITGKGPQKSHYQSIISAREWKHVNIVTPWLEAENYPKLLVELTNPFRKLNPDSFYLWKFGTMDANWSPTLIKASLYAASTDDIIPVAQDSYIASSCFYEIWEHSTMFFPIFKYWTMLMQLSMHVPNLQSWHIFYYGKITADLLFNGVGNYRACADLGVSLHTSSSGLDLPMKVVDMFGCGLPVAAINFKCLNELVQHKENGMVFKDSKELTQQFVTLFKEFPNVTVLNRLRNNVQNFRNVSWDDTWNKIALPLFQV